MVFSKTKKTKTRLLKTKTVKKRFSKKNKRAKNKGSKIKKNKTRRLHKKYRGGLKEYTVSAAIDTNLLLNHYLQKRIIGKEKYQDILQYENYNFLKFGPTDLLMVIDMQNDFVDRPVQYKDGKDELTGPLIPGLGKIGAFAVTHGTNIINPILDLVKKCVTNNGKVVFTRDVHPCDHCSFFKADCGDKPTIHSPTGPFPPHCINQSVGSGFVEEIYVYLQDEYQILSNNIDDDEQSQISVVFKGCDRNTDSFGAYKYQDDNYGKARQIKCEPKDLSNTGAFYANNVDYISKAVNNDNFDAVNLLNFNEFKLIKNNFEEEKIKKAKPFEIPKNIENIYVVGLAGDYCVCDTAMNLKSAYPGKNVSVIYELTRNAFIPFGETDEATLKIVQANQSNKPLNNYAFKLTEKGHFLSLNPVELKNLTADNLKGYFHFLTDIEVLFDRYKEKGVKVILPKPHLKEETLNL